jgi:excisionase family DNA binding protein
MNTETNPSDFSTLSPLLKAEEVAKLLNVSRAFSYFLMQSGQLPTVKLGRAVRVRPQDLLGFIEKNLNSQADNH